jgi:hypothetical protein
MLLDKEHHRQASAAWWAHAELAKDWMLTQDADEAKHHDAWEKHVADALEMVHAPSLGRPPADLARLLAQVAVAAPATCALRSMSRDEADRRIGTCLAAARVGHAFLALFNVPEIRALLLGINPAERIGGECWSMRATAACKLSSTSSRIYFARIVMWNRKSSARTFAR